MGISYDRLDAKNKAAVDKFLGKSGGNSGGSSGGASGGGSNGGGGGSSKNKSVDLANEAKYLGSLIGTGADSWARQQAASLGLRDYDLVPFLPSNTSSGSGGSVTKSLVPSLVPNVSSNMSALIPGPPKLDIDPYKPYKIREFEYDPPDYSITSDPTKTQFVPTLGAKNQWLQQEQMRANEHQNAYNSQINLTNLAQDQWYKQNSLGLQRENMLSPWMYGPTPYQQQQMNLSLLPYTTPTVAQQLDQQRWDAEWPYKQRAYEYDLNKPYPNSGSGGGGGTGGLSPYQNEQSTRYYNTQDFVGTLLSFEDPRQARSFYNTNSAAAAGSGVDLYKAMQAMKMRWPDYFGPDGGSSEFWYPTEE